MLLILDLVEFVAVPKACLKIDITITILVKDVIPNTKKAKLLKMTLIIIFVMIKSM